MRDLPPPVDVLLLSDGRPGHFNLAEGIAAAIGRLRPARIVRLEVRRRRWLPGRLAAAMLGAGIPSRCVLRLVHGLAAADLPAADVVVSAGAETMPANVAAARLLGAPNIFYGSLRAFPPGWFALTLTSYDQQAGTPHPVATLKPSRLDPAALPARAWPGPGRPPGSVGLLVGGDGGGTRFGEADWTALVALVERCAAAWGARFIVANSRRTPEAISDRLATLAARPGADIARMIDVRRSGPGTLDQVLAEAEAVLVTADSSSMLSEIVWACRPAISLAPQQHRLTPQEAEYRATLATGGQCRELALAAATPARLLDAMAGLRPLAGNPLDALAALIARHIPRLAPAGGPG